MIFRIKKASLPKDCRNDFKDILGRGMTAASLEGLVSEVNKLLRVFEILLLAVKERNVNSKDMRREVAKLKRVLEVTSPETLRELGLVNLRAQRAEAQKPDLPPETKWISISEIPDAPEVLAEDILIARQLIPAAEKCTTPALEKCTTPEVV